MARRGSKTNGEEAIGLVALLPWWLGLVLAVAAYFFFHALAKPPAIAVAHVDHVGTAVIGSLIAAAALALQVRRADHLRRRRDRLRCQTAERSSLIRRVTSSSAAGALDGMIWQEFELLVGEAFRLQGFAVEERGDASADGGLDLVVRRDGQRYFVQCKQWKVLLGPLCWNCASPNACKSTTTIILAGVKDSDTDLRWQSDIGPLLPAQLAGYNGVATRPPLRGRLFGVRFSGRLMIVDNEMRFSIESRLFGRGAAEAWAELDPKDYDGSHFGSQLSAALKQELLAPETP